MEPQTTVCIPIEDGLDVYSATQWTDLSHAAISECLNIPQSSINMSVRRLGGAYGAKISRSVQIACACALGTFITKRPVRFVMTIEANMTIIGKRLAVMSEYDIDVDDNGKIQKLTNNFAEDYGCSPNEPVAMFTPGCFKNCYISDSWTVNSQMALTDSPSHTWCRAPGSVEGIAMIENIMEHIARVTGKDPIDVRLANISEDNDIHKLMPDFLKQTGKFNLLKHLQKYCFILDFFFFLEFYERKKEVNTFNENNRWRKRGIAVIPMKYPLEYFGTYGIFIAIYHMDGTVAVSHGGIEMGQGINTKVAQVVAHCLGIPLEYVNIKPTNTLTAANTFISGGSITSEVVCFVSQFKNYKYF